MVIPIGRRVISRPAVHFCGEPMRWVQGSKNNSSIVARRLAAEINDAGHWWCASCKKVELHQDEVKK